MGFAEAVRTALTKYFDFSGRARRSEYWWFFLFAVLLYIAAAVVDYLLGIGVVTLLALAALAVPSLAVGARRLHDTDRSGWLQLLGILPLLGLVVFVWCVLDSKPEANRHGTSPKYA